MNGSMRNVLKLIVNNAVPIVFIAISAVATHGIHNYYYFFPTAKVPSRTVPSQWQMGA